MRRAGSPARSHKLFAMALSIATLLLLQANGVFGQFDPPLPAGTLAPSWSSASVPGVAPLLTPQVPFRFWIVAVAPPGGIEGYEFTVDMPPCLQIVDRSIFPWPGAWDASPDADEYIVGTGGICLSGDAVVLVEYEALALSDDCFTESNLISLSPTTPTSFSPPSPGYLECDVPGALHPFQVGPPLSLGAGGTVAQARIWSFAAVPSRLHPGESGTLRWATSGGESVWIEPGGFTDLPDTGEVVVDPPGTTQYTLVASNVLGQTSATTTVQRVPYRIVSFTAQPETIVVPGSVTLSWAVTGSAMVLIDGFGPQPMTGTRIDAPAASRSYTLRATGGGITETATVHVVVIDPGQSFTIRQFGADPSAITPGQPVLLYWEVDGVADVSIDGLGPQPHSGTTIVHPQQRTTYVLRARNQAVEKIATTTVTLLGEPGGLGVIGASWASDSYPGTTPAIAPFVPFTFWILAFDPPGGMEAYEFSIPTPPGMIVSQGRVLPSGATDFGAGDDNYIIGTGGICREGPTVQLVTYRGCLFLGMPPSDARIGVRGAAPSSFPTGAPGYLTCLAAGDLRPFTVAPDLELFPQPIVPAVVVGLQATNVADGIRVAWEIDGATQVESIELVRRDAAASGPQQLFHREGPAAAVADTWTDTTALPGRTYRYLLLVRMHGTAAVTAEAVAVRAGGAVLPQHTRLLAAVPNPFNPRTEIRFELSRPGDARLSVFDAAGRLVRTAELPALTAGPHAWTWDGADASGHGVSSGVYRVRLQSGESSDVLSVTVVR